MPPVTFTGLASGLDTRAVIDAILNVERQPLERLEARRQVFNQRKAAFDELRAKLDDFENVLRDLASERKFRGREVTVGDESFLRATAGTGAETGVFDLEVLALASAGKVKSDGFLARDQGLVADGTITLQAGDNEQIVIDVSSADGNNSLELIRDAINDADAGVQAAILFDGSEYLLTVRSEETGTANGLTISDTTDLNLDEATNLVSTAGDAQLRIDGASGITITSASNKVSGVIPGVTLELLSETEGSSVTVEVSQDEDSVVEAVQDLVAKYNDIVSFFGTQFNRDNPGPLSSDATARLIQNRLQNLFTGGVDGIPFGEIRSLSAVGVSFDGKTGKATLDAAALREVLDTNFEEVGNLFLSSGRSTDFRIGFVSATSATAAGTYAVGVTQAAEQASVQGSTAITTLGADETLTIETGGNSTAVLLSAGSDISAVVDALNAALRDDGVAATAVNDGGRLRINSQAFGSATDISVTSSLADPGNGSQTGFDTAASVDQGVDVAGTIGGVAAIGAGQILTGADDGDYAGLQIKVTATAAAIAATGGDFGEISFSRGLMDDVLQTVDLYTKFGSGTIDSVREGIDISLKSLARDIDRVNERLALREVQLTRTFTRAEQAIAALNAQQAAFGGFSL